MVTTTRPLWRVAASAAIVLVGLVLGVVMVPPAAQAQVLGSPQWSAGAGPPGSGITEIRLVCNIAAPNSGTRTQDQGYQLQAACIQGTGRDLAGDSGEFLHALGLPLTRGGAANYHGASVNEVMSFDAAEGYWYGTFTAEPSDLQSGSGSFTAPSSCQTFQVGGWWADGTNGTSSGAAGFYGFQMNLCPPIDIVAGEQVAFPARPQAAINAGVDPYVGPSYCDITGVVGDVSETVPKDPSQTYRYEISFAGRNGMTPAPDQIGFSASWQENNPSAKVPYANITTVSPDAVKQVGETWAGIAQWPTPPLVSPLIINVQFPEPKLYAIRIGCLSDDGKISYWTGGDFLPDPHTEEIADDLRDQRLQECVPSGWGLLNPVAYARVTGCVFNYLFVPRKAKLQDHWDSVSDVPVISVVSETVGVFTTAYDRLDASIDDHCFNADYSKAMPDGEEAGYSFLNIHLPAPSSAGCGGSNVLVDPSNDAGNLWGWRTTIRTALLVVALMGATFKLISAFAPGGDPDELAPEGASAKKGAK